MNKGLLSIVLHAHLPYVRHVDRNDALEERWVYEAMLETYIPLLQMFERLAEEGVPFRVTVSLSPTLLSMLHDSLIQQRFRRYLQSRLELAMKEVRRTSDRPEEQRIARMYLDKFRAIAASCSKWQYQLIPAFVRLQERGVLELITCSATHAFLPYLMTEEAIRAQIRTALDLFEQVIGRRPKGFWLPECAIAPGIDRLLAEQGIDYCFVEAHALDHATPMPRRGLFAPLVTPHGTAVFARDPETTKQVWSSEVGYPGDYDYREYYRDIGFDLDFDYIAPYIHPDGIRIHTGLKYHRVSGKTDAKEWYNPEKALAKAEEHAAHFLAERQRQLAEAANVLDREPLIVAPFDMELFGHWWYEGPQFLESLLRRIASPEQQQVELITPGRYLARYPEQDRARIPMSSWGRNGYGEVWLNERNDWIYRHLHRAEREMIHLAETYGTSADHVQHRAVQQAGRELMLAQSSDWAFMMDNQSMVSYAVQRTHDHLVRFWRLSEGLRKGTMHETELSAMERDYPIFPNLSPMDYLPYGAHRVNVSHTCSAAAAEGNRAPCVVMLTWEYPPHTVGGLGKAVYDLSRYLAKQHVEVHVLTGGGQGHVEREVADGVFVHRVPTYTPGQQTEFLDWVFQLNLALMDQLEHLYREGLPIAVVHAHDWLVAWAAQEAKERLGLPVVATIHATEHGRNQGIHTPLQERIHRVEQELTAFADRVIVCSHYMADEVHRLFGVPREKLAIIPNGVEPAAAPDEQEVRALEDLRQQVALPHERVLFFVGRLVPEKGVQLLLQAAPAILQSHPDVKFVIAGKGPMLETLRREAADKGLQEKFLLLGYIDDRTRNRLYRLAEAVVFPSLYEPFGIVVLEAMAYGAMVLCADTGGMRELVRHRENGLTMYAGNVHSLVDQIRWLLDHPAETRQLARRAQQELAEGYDWHRLSFDTWNIYRDLLFFVCPPMAEPISGIRS